MKVTQSCLTLCDPVDYTVHGILQARILEWVVFPFQGIFSTQGLNPRFLHCRRILYQLSHKGNPRIVEWVAYPFSRGSSRSRNQTGVSCIAGGLSALQKFSALQAESPALQAGSPALQKESITLNDVFL